MLPFLGMTGNGNSRSPLSSSSQARILVLSQSRWLGGGEDGGGVGGGGDDGDGAGGEGGAGGESGAGDGGVGDGDGGDGGVGGAVPLPCGQLHAGCGGPSLLRHDDGGADQKLVARVE